MVNLIWSIFDLWPILTDSALLIPILLYHMLMDLLNKNKHYPIDILLAEF